MAALMENKGLLIAMDLYESKLKQLKIRAKRDEHLISNVHHSTKSNQKATSESRSCTDRCTMQWFRRLKRN
jgi:16S rRNA C967 or C1407 C5-methylase (RsmB/RsmF family)